ncbi:MAG: hypothetical protein IJ092_03190 [Atopobiaceae bacterium]|nr:hypothetical protein [Atopobiaceae bacterium]
MATNASKVNIGLADYTTGAVTHGPVITGNIPDTLAKAETATSGFAKSGYCDEAGLEMSMDYSTNDLKEWNGATVRKLLESFDGSFTFNLMQAFSYEDACIAFGEENVTKTAATSTKGEQLHIKVGAHLPERQAWCFNMKDGDTAMKVLVPCGQVTSLDSITFVANDAIKLPVTVSCYDDGSGTGDSIHIYTDDGKTSA